MAFVGTITRTNGPKPYVARLADGKFMGTFASFREAEVPVQGHSGTNRLRWTQEARADGVEAYRGEDRLP